MLAKEAMLQSLKVQDARFWRERAECMELIARAAKLGSTKAVVSSWVADDVRDALLLMGYAVTIHSSDMLSPCYTTVEWSHAQV